MNDFDFALGQNADLIRESANRFSMGRIAPLAYEIDAKDWFLRELWPEICALGPHSIIMEEVDGGLGLGSLVIKCVGSLNCLRC